MPFQVQSPATGLFSGRVGRLGCRAIEHVLGLGRINAVHDMAARATTPLSFVDRALEALDVAVEVPDTDLVAAIPRNGPLIVVANHPFGGVDGLAMASVLRRVRPDLKLLANELLGRVPELRDVLLLVDAFGRDDGRSRNRAAMRAAMRHLESGGCVGVFPAGEVSYLSSRGRSVSDGPWSATATRLASACDAAVLPIFFEGRNSAIFQIAGLVHPKLRTALLPRELLKRRGSRVVMHVGTVVPPQRLAKFQDAHEATDYLRLRTYLLGGRAEKRTATKPAALQQPVATPGDVEAMAGEIAALDECRKLVSAKQLDVYLARGDAMPQILREIGRLREITFRAVGEGTGKPLDLDTYDRFYHHLFVWNRESGEVVAAYRLGLTDEILPRFGGEGLYASTLFRFRDELLRQLTPGIELGRSFVRGEYQKSYLPLMLLWKGIGTFVSRNPRYRLLFGPVSISNDYASLTRQILVAFLECNAKLPALARLLAPKNPPNFGPGRRSEAALAGTVVSSIEEVDELVAEIERDRRRVPVLLRQYLKLGAKLLAFNVDPDFGDVLDGLMLIDLAQVHPHVLARYMGAGEVRAYRAFHGVA